MESRELAKQQRPSAKGETEYEVLVRYRNALKEIIINEK
jgi:hypothetical protein